MQPTAESFALELSALRKSYGAGLLGRKRRTVLEGLDLQVRRGEIFGFLGPNGSGKTTTLKIALGLCPADSGSVRILGLAHDDPVWRQRVGYLPEQPYLYDHLSAREYLHFVGRLFGLAPSERERRAAALLERVGLAHVADQRLRSYSKGMQQRTALAQALINEPELVLLDEPMSGLDPFGRRLVRDIIADLRRKGRTVLFSTHILSDAESLCDRVALLRAGALLAVGRLDEILKFDGAQLEMLVSGVAPEALATFPAGTELHDRLGERLRLGVAEASLGQAVLCVERAGGRVLQVNPLRQSLEDYFVREMGAVTGDLA